MTPLTKTNKPSTTAFLLRFWLTVLLALPWQALQAAPNQQVLAMANEYLSSKAEQVARQNDASHYHFHATPLTKKAKLTPCKAKIIIKDISQSAYGEQFLMASCHSHWEVMVKGRIQVFLPVIVADRNIPKNHQVNENDLGWKTVDLGLITSNYLRQPEQVLSRTSLHPIKAGTPVTPDMFR